MATQASGRVVRRIEVDDGQPIRSNEKLVEPSRDCSNSTHDASATSRPEGEMVAEPTRPSTRKLPSASKLSLSKADLMIFPFRGGSVWSKEGMMMDG